MKKIATALVCISFFFLFAFFSTKQVSAHVNDSFRLYLDGRLLNTESPPQLVNNTMLVPLRIVSEELGANVIWNQAQKLITLNKDKLNLQLGIDKKEALVNGQKQLLDAPPLLVNDHTLIPVRFVSENLGLVVEWDSQTHSVLLESKSPFPDSGSDTNNLSDIIGIELDDSTLKITATGGSIKPVVSQMSDPVRLVVDIPDAALGRSINGQEQSGQGGKIALDHSNVSDIRYSLFQNQPSTVRIVLDLKQEQEISYESKGGDVPNEWFLSLNFDSPDGKDALNDPASSPSKGSINDNLPAINLIELDGDTLKIAAEGGSIEPTVSQLSNPERLVVDIPNAVLGSEINGEQVGLNGEISLENSYANTIRYALFQNNQSTVRVIIDLKQKISFEVWDGDEPLGEWALQLKTKKTDGGQKQYRVVIDAGHGGSDTGAIAASGKYEKDFTLPMALKVANILEQNNSISVYLTRNDDTYPELAERAKLANDVNADVFVSIHGNSFTENRAVTGTETHYTREDSRPLAEIIHRHLLEGTGFKDRGVIKSNYLVTRETAMPAILLEIGFLSNPQEEKTMWDEQFQMRVAKAIAEGIEEYLHVTQ